MMNSKQKEEQDRYILRMLGNHCQLGYHSLAAPASSSTLGRAVETAKIPDSSRRASLEVR